MAKDTTNAKDTSTNTENTKDAKEKKKKYKDNSSKEEKAIKKCTSVAHPNIALVKYWGKRDEELILPHNSSLSVTLDNLYTKATVEFNQAYDRDIFILNGREIVKGSKYQRVVEHLNLIRGHTKDSKKAKLFAKIVSETNFPVAAGLASSTSAFAALTFAATNALGLELSNKELSMIAREGSGSACRSIFSGFVEWKKGSRWSGKESSYGEQIVDKDFWPEFKVVILMVEYKEKDIKSRPGMKISVLTSPYYKAWVETADFDLNNLKQALLKKDFSALGKVAEHNCMKLHSVMLSSQPPVIYWQPETLFLIKWVREQRKNGLEIYFTIDAGPNVKVLCLEKDINTLISRLEQVNEVQDFIVCNIGDGPKLVEEHLF